MEFPDKKRILTIRLAVLTGERVCQADGWNLTCM